MPRIVKARTGKGSESVRRVAIWRRTVKRIRCVRYAKSLSDLNYILGSRKCSTFISKPSKIKHKQDHSSKNLTS